VFVVDAEGCMTTSDITVNSPEALEVKAVVEDELFGQDGNIQLSVNGGTAPYQYSWSNGATSENLNNIHSGNYSITVSDRNGCNETLQMSVSGNEELGENTMLHMRMFPNPATGEMNIQFSKTVNGTLQVVGVNGKQLIRTSLSTIQYQLDLSQYAEGLYYMVVTPENGQAVTTSFTISK
jgi:VCBS repeat-containing protein